MANFCQFNVTKFFFKIKRMFWVKFKTYIVKFSQENIISNHNIEIFKQVSNYTTCLQPIVAIFLWMIIILATTQNL